MTVKRIQDSGIPAQIESSEADLGIVTNNKDPDSYVRTGGPFSKDVFETQPEKNVIDSISQKYTMFDSDQNGS